MFTHKEVKRFLKKFKVTITTEYSNDVIAVVEHAKLNPVEDDISNMAYEQGKVLYRLSELEKILSGSINDDELLMAIKLTNDQERVFRLLGNENISDRSFCQTT